MSSGDQKSLFLKFEKKFLFKRQVKYFSWSSFGFHINFMFERQNNIFEKFNDPWFHMFILLYSDVFVVVISFIMTD